MMKANSSSPLIRIRGRKTTTVVRVAMVTASPTSPAPRIDASRGPAPSCRRRWMFSTMTMALSTTRPRLSMSPIMVIRFRLQPMK